MTLYPAEYVIAQVRAIKTPQSYCKSHGIRATAFQTENGPHGRALVSELFCASAVAYKLSAYAIHSHLQLYSPSGVTFCRPRPMGWRPSPKV